MGVKVKAWKGAWWIFINHQGRRRAKRCASKKAAELAADKIDAALRLGQTEVLEASRRRPPDRAPTFRDYSARWLEAVGPVRLRPSTIEQYHTRLRVRILPTLGDVPLTSITRATIRGLISDMVKAGNRRSLGKPVAKGSVQAALRTVSSILATAEEDGLIPANPCRRMGGQVAHTGAVQDAQEIEVFRHDELATLLDVAARDWPAWHPFVLCLARTGMRLGEAVGLEWRDVDLEDRVIFIRRSYRRGRLSEPKNGKVRRVDMSQHLTAVLRGLKSLKEAEAVVQGSALPERVFSNAEGSVVQDDGFRNNIWAPLLRRAGLRYRKPHTLRHTFASLLIENGETLPYIQHQLGHHSAGFTLKVYGHLIPRQGRRGVDALDEAIIRNPDATEHQATSLEASRSR